MSQTDQRPVAVEAGTLMQKPLPPRMVEPYLTGRRSVISGFVQRVADTGATTPAELFDAFSLGYEGSEFSPDMAEIYLLRWRAVGTQAYHLPDPADGRAAAEFFTEPIALPVGAEIYCVRTDSAEFIARFDGQAWLRPEGGPQL